MMYAELIDKMTLEEKASLLSGKDCWHTKNIDRLGIPSIMVADGPHGLRKQNPDNLGVHESVKATCFPTAVTCAATWNTELEEELGATIGEECLQEKVSILLGPGVNMKRSPLCGRNFEYFSEDPYLAGHMASAFINGVQSKGIGTSLKHFAVNSQEERRLSISSTLDERTLREIYLTQFEIAVKNAHPYTLMCSYNRINGVYSSENPLLLNKILRDEWGYDGVVMSDWGAVNNRPLGVSSGLDLEMPGNGGINDKKIVEAVGAGKLSERMVDTAVDNMLSLIFKCHENIREDYKYDIDEHNSVAEKVAIEGAVLLKNKDNILPLDRDKKVLVIGALAESPRFQGAGSSHVCAHKITSILDELDALHIPYEYAPGYELDSRRNSKKRRTYALDRAKEYDKILLTIGLTDEYEAEGFDRSSLALPEAQLTLIDELTRLGKSIVVDIQCGSPITMEWADKIDGILLSYLGGQATGSAAVKLLYGYANPSGKLAETFPLSLKDNPSYHYFPGDKKSTQYREGIYVGYRYYTTAEVDVLYPFGYGMSYSTFEYSDLNIESNNYRTDESVHFSMNITNTSDVDGKEVVEVYVGARCPHIDRPKRELVAFKKLFIKAHETVSVEFTLEPRAFSYYDVESHDYIIDKGDYDIIVAKNVCDSSLVGTVTFTNGNEENKRLSPNSWYNHPSGNVITDEDFARLIKIPLPTPYTCPQKGEYSVESCFDDMMPTSWLARRMAKIVRFGIKTATHVKSNDPGLLMAYKTFLYSPLRSIPSTSQGVLSGTGVEGMVTMFNGHIVKGLNMMIKDAIAQAKAHKKEAKKVDGKGEKI